MMTPGELIAKADLCLNESMSGLRNASADEIATGRPQEVARLRVDAAAGWVEAAGGLVDALQPRFPYMPPGDLARATAQRNAEINADLDAMADALEKPHPLAERDMEMAKERTCRMMGAKTPFGEACELVEGAVREWNTGVKRWRDSCKDSIPSAFINLSVVIDAANRWLCEHKIGPHATPDNALSPRGDYEHLLTKPDQARYGADKI
ncbi:MAG: hypothetical protein GY851_26555 [bacterium]|nr:hypothetical protein [bacterium]